MSRDAGAAMDFEVADYTTKREVLAGALCNLHVEDDHIGSYQWKGLLGFLERSAEGAPIHKWSCSSGRVCNGGTPFRSVACALRSAGSC